MGQMAAAALFHPYSTYGILLVGTVLITMGVWQRRRLSAWLKGLPKSANVTMGVFCTLEIVPAFVAAFGVWTLVGYTIGGRIGRLIISVGGLFPGTLERVGHGIGALIGGVWGFTAGFVVMETLAGLIGVALAYTVSKAVRKAAMVCH